MVFCAALFAPQAEAQVIEGEGFFVLLNVEMNDADRKELLNSLRQEDPSTYYVEIVRNGNFKTYGNMDLKDMELISTEVNSDPARYADEETTVIHETVWQHKKASISRVADEETTVVNKTVWQHKSAAISRSTESQVTSLLAKYQK